MLVHISSATYNDSQIILWVCIDQVIITIYMVLTLFETYMSKITNNKVEHIIDI